MGAAQSHLGEMQWRVQWLNGTLGLRDHGGDVWQPSPEYGTGLMRHMLEEARIQHLRSIAAQNRHGAGMEQGLDLTLTTNHYSWYIKQGEMSQTGALMAVYTGALWPGDRLTALSPCTNALFAIRQGMMRYISFIHAPN
eukprot:3896144-Karenia_brevis.AAC.1